MKKNAFAIIIASLIICTSLSQCHELFHPTDYSPVSAFINGEYYKSEDYYTRDRFYGATELHYTDTCFRFCFRRVISSKNRSCNIYMRVYSDSPLKENIKYQLFQYDLMDLAHFSYYDSDLDKIVDITAYSGSVEFTDILRNESETLPIGLSGNFEFQAINPITKDTVYVTDGAFENVRFEATYTFCSPWGPIK